MRKSDRTNSKSDDESLEISKSQRKRDAHELLDLAKKLIAMPASRLARMPMDTDLREEVNFARSIRSNGARKRQLMTVGKMIRNIDAEPLIDAVYNVDNKNRQQSARHHHVEAWRDRLIEDSGNALTEILEYADTANMQALRQLVRNAKKELQLNKPPASARKLFKLLREMNEQESLPPII